MYYFALSDCDGNLKALLDKSREPKNPHLEFELGVLN
jgi:hypothetical protein